MVGIGLNLTESSVNLLYNLLTQSIQSLGFNGSLLTMLLIGTLSKKRQPRRRGGQEDEAVNRKVSI